MTINHGLDTMPDFVMVYLSFSSSVDTSSYPLQLSYGFNTAIGEKLGLTTLRGAFYHNFYNSTQSTGMDSTTSSSGFITCNDDSTFTVKNSTNDNGKLAEATYQWIAISGMGGGVASSDEDICYVTFMSEDGTTEYGKKAVIVGDDCMEPVSHGLFDEPTKDPTNTIVYNHSGWSLTASGSADSSALLNVTEDRTVYCAFAESVRYYTVRFFDGETLLTTQEVTYGGTADYTTTKEDYQFNGWEPSNTNITADTDCYAQWVSEITFANATWAQVVSIAESGEVSSYFAVGDTKTLELSDGQILTVKIADFDHDDLADGSGKAGISIMCINPVGTTGYPMMSSGSNYGGWTSSKARTYLNNDIFALLPDELSTSIKTVTKTCDSGGSTQSLKTSNDKLWLPSLDELNLSSTSSYTTGQGTKYPIFSNRNSRIRYKHDTTSTVAWWTRSSNSGSTGYWKVIMETGDASAAGPASSNWLIFGFCI